LGGGEEGGDVLVACSGAAAVKGVIGEEGLVGVDLAVYLCGGDGRSRERCSGSGCRLRGERVE
jgi:hypothetical protein